MAYDPRMMQQMAQMGIGMLGPQQGSDARPKPWWGQPLPSSGQSANQPANADQPDPPGTKPPPSLLDMMLSLGRMTPAEYAKAQQGGGGGAYGSIRPRDAAQVSPWAWLGSMYGGGGAGAKS